MKLPDGRVIIVDEGILADSASADDRILLWVRGESAGGYQRWERVTAAPSASVTDEQGVRSIAVTATATRQRTGMHLTRLLPFLSRDGGDPVWTLPGGGQCERCGPRRTDVVLAWAAEQTASVDEPGIRARWPGCGEIRQLCQGLYLVSGIGIERIDAGPPPADVLPEAVPARRLAEMALDAARQAGDPAGEVTALIDLAVTCLNKLDPKPAVPLLEEALAAARRLADRTREADALGNLGQAAVLLRRPRVAIQILEPLLVLLRDLGDAHAEKLALERLGHARQALGEHQQALAHFEGAVQLALKLGDRRHAATLLWHVGIELGELGQHDRALEHAETAVELHRRLGTHEAEHYARHLAEYRSALRAPSHVGATNMCDGSITTSAIMAVPTQSTTPAAGPGALRMALSAAKSAAKFAGSGFQTVAPTAYQSRLAACSTCDQYTGLRCRVCGCFIKSKARLPHEDCPVGRWPRSSIADSSSPAGNLR